jgi:hypothetical protein
LRSGPPTVAAECQAWRLPAKFNAVEDSGFFVVFSMTRKSENEYDGSVYYNDWKTYREVKGTATARLDGPRLDITAQWATTPTGGGHFTYYKGTIDGSGFIGGLRKDPLLREGDKNREVFFKSKQQATCVTTSSHNNTGGIRDRIEAIKKAQQGSASATPSPSSPTPPTQPSAQRAEQNVNRLGRDYRHFEVPIERYQSCVEACEADGRCKAYTYVRAGVQGPRGVCWLKDSVPAKSANRCCVSGALR